MHLEMRPQMFIGWNTMQNLKQEFSELLSKERKSEYNKHTRPNDTHTGFSLSAGCQLKKTATLLQFLSHLLFVK